MYRAAREKWTRLRKVIVLNWQWKGISNYIPKNGQGYSNKTSQELHSGGIYCAFSRNECVNAKKAVTQ